MWVREYSKIYKDLNPQNIWEIWTDINNWPAWHDDLESCALEGNFEIGNHFILKPKGSRAVKIKLTEITPGKSFTDCTVFPGAKMYDTHTLEETPTGLRLTNKLVVTGFFSWLWIKLVAKHIADTVPQEMDALVKLAKQNE